MAQPAEEPLADAVARAHGDLLRLAVLLEGDRADAEDLVRTTLVATGLRRRWSDDLPARARTALVRRFLGSRGDGPRTSAWVDDVRADDDLRQALDGLPRRTRAALVLALAARAGPAEVADALRVTEDAARTEIAAGTASLRPVLVPALPSWRPYGTATTVDPDDDLRRELAGLADRLAGPAADPAATATGVLAGVATRRRRRGLVALAAACLVGIGAVGVVTASDPAPPAAAARAEGARPPVVEVTELPTRGSLADDEEFLAGMVRRPWTGVPTELYPVGFTPARGSIRVAFAADVPAGRWALLVARPEQGDDRPEAPPRDDALVAWFTGPPGAAPERMELSSYPYPLRTGAIPTLLDPATGTLAVVAAPGDVVEVSESAELDAEGASSRTWDAVPVVDGVSVTRLPVMALPWPWTTSYRVIRDGSTVVTAPPDALMTESDPGLPELDVDYRGTSPTDEGRQAAEWAAFSAVAAFQLGPGDARIAARLVAPVPSPGRGAVALVTVELPSGALVVSAQWASALPEGEPGGADCGMDVRPAGPPPEERVLAAGCGLFAPADGRTLDGVLVVTTPPSVELLRAYRGDGGLAGEWPVRDGRLVTAMPPGVQEVEAVTANGVQLGRTELLGHWRGPAG